MMAWRASRARSQCRIVTQECSSAMGIKRHRYRAHGRTVAMSGLRSAHLEARFDSAQRTALGCSELHWKDFARSEPSHSARPRTIFN